MPGVRAALFQPFPMLAGRRAQVWRHQPQFRRPRHFHEEPEINIVLRGFGMMGIGEYVRPIAAGDMIAFQPGQDHVLLEASDDFDLFVMALRPDLAERALAGASNAGAPAFRLPLEDLPDLADNLLGLGTVNDAASHETQVTDLFLKLRSAPVDVHVLTRRALRSVIGEPGVSGGALAHKFRTTPSNVSRHYHRDLGLTLTEHRARMKLIRFVRLVDTGLDLIDAALAADFGSYAQCHRVFRRLVGCAPRDYFADFRALVDDATFSGVVETRL